MTGDRVRVLVVDDEADVLLLCRVNLEFDGYEVVEARDGETAMTRLRDARPDVVLLDVVLPNMDGWQVLDAIKADAELRDVPVVLLTARAGAEDQRRAWSAGAAEYLTKPFSPLALSQVLEDVLATTPEDEAQRRGRILEQLRLAEDA